MLGEVDDRGDPQRAHGGAQQLLQRARKVLGDRWAEVTVDTDRVIHLKVLDLSARDVAALADIATQLGIRGRTLFERADPSDLPLRARLDLDLARLQRDQPGVLQTYPPVNVYRRPLRVQLQPGAHDTAAELWNHYGKLLDLKVGDQPYPADREPTPPHRHLPPSCLDDPGDVRVELDGPLTVASGSTTWHAVLLTNKNAAPIDVVTNGHLTAVIVDPDTGEAVGGYARPQQKRGATHHAEPAETLRIRLLVGTDSFDLDRGYFLPPGTWELAIHLKLRGQQRLTSPPQRLTITDPT